MKTPAMETPSRLHDVTLFVMADFMRKHGFQFRLGELGYECVEKHNFAKTSEPGEEGVGVTRPFAAVHYFDAARWKIGAPRQCEEAFAQGEPSGSGVNLLKSGMITAGAMSSKSN